MSAIEIKTRALAAAWDWVGAYEASDPSGGDVTLEGAFEECGTAGKVKARYPDFPEDIVDAYALLRRSVQARVRASRA